MSTVAAFLAQGDMPERVIFCCFDDAAARLHHQAITASRER
ncbi:macro domain-containing protein [Mesorhizobium xinjiangense]|nr:hypothetical protein [Mesorhizobium xinjiangense]